MSQKTREEDCVQALDRLQDKLGKVRQHLLPTWRKVLPNSGSRIILKRDALNFDHARRPLLALDHVPCPCPHPVLLVLSVFFRSVFFRSCALCESLGVVMYACSTPYQKLKSCNRCRVTIVVVSVDKRLLQR